MGSCRALLSVCALALLVCSPGHAFAQAANLHSSITDDMADAEAAAELGVPLPPATLPEEAAPPRRIRRMADPYMPPPMGDGVIDFRASLGVQGVYTSNVKGSAAVPRGDVGLRLTPTLSFGTNWPRHEWHGTLTGDFITYASTPSANAYSGSAATGARIDVRRDTQIDLDASLGTALSTPGDPEVPGTALGAARSWTFDSSGALSHDYGPWAARVKLGLKRNAYDDVALSGGGVEANSDRNYWEPGLALRSSLGSRGARLRPFVEVSYDPRLHDTAVDRNGQNRNSQGGGLAVGLSLDDGPIWMGDISANFIARDYDDPALKTAMALGVNGTLTWSPTPLWNVVATSGVGLGESAQAGVSATPSWNAGLQANYAVRENVRLTGGVNFAASSAAAGLDTTTSVNLGGEWQLNPYLSLSGSLQNTWFRTASGAGDYTEQRVVTGMVLRH
jgi:hypothetical protein